MRRLRIGMAQVNTTVGDFEGNTRKIIRTIDEARSLGVDLLTFPELAVCGYPPEDLLLKPHFIQENLKALERIVQEFSRHHRGGRFRRLQRRHLQCGGHRT